MKLENRTKKNIISSKVMHARSIFARMKGLLGHKNLMADEVMWIEPCKSIHTWFMRFPIDAVFVNQNLQVVTLKSNIHPWRLVWPNWQATSVFELPQGTIAKKNIESGDQLYVGP